MKLKRQMIRIELRNSSEAIVVEIDSWETEFAARELVKRLRRDPRVYRATYLCDVSASFTTPRAIVDTIVKKATRLVRS